MSEWKKVIYLDLAAKVKAEPLFCNLAELVEENPRQALQEINDTFNALGIMNDRELCFLLMGYLQGICAHSIAGTRAIALAELRARLQAFFNEGNFNYRRLLR